MNLYHATTPKSAPSRFNAKEIANSTNPRVVLNEIFELLEEYGPMWYTEELHDRAKAALTNYH